MNVTVQGIEAAQLRGTLIRLRYAAWLKKLGHFICALVVAYAAACSYLWLTQGSLIFNPDSQIDLTPEDYGIAYREVRIPVTDASQGELHGWWLPARGERVLVYLHGNSGNIGSNLPHAVRFHKLGFSVLLFDYRGFGQSRGSFPSEEHLYEDAWGAWNWLLNEGIRAEQIIIYGHSLGGAVAIDLAGRVSRAGGLIVEGTFTSMREVVDSIGRYHLFPVDLLLRERFDSISKVRSLKLPILFIHGTADLRIPFEMSERLHEAAPALVKRLVLIHDGGHSSSANVGRRHYFEAVQTFVKEAKNY